MSNSPTPAEAAPSWEESMRLLDRLPALAMDERAEAIKLLLRNPSPGVRERALRVGATVLPQETLVDYLGDGADAVLRNAGLEILKLRGARSFSLAIDLLREGDPDLVLQAVLLLDHIRDPRALEPLRAVLGHADGNVAQAAIVAIGHLGDARAISDLLPFLEADIWLRMAAVQALGDLRSEQAVGALTPLLTDLMIGPLAAEALARIGGVEAFHALGEHWLRYHEQLAPRPCSACWRTSPRACWRSPSRGTTCAPAWPIGCAIRTPRCGWRRLAACWRWVPAPRTPRR